MPGVFDQRLALVYLARGADHEPLYRFDRFAQSFKQFAPMAEHDLFIIFKGFRSRVELRAGQAMFEGLQYVSLFTDDDNFDIGAYSAACKQIPHEFICFMNTNSEVLCHGWLGKLAANFDPATTGCVGATGSFESLSGLDVRFPPFPNVHLRSNAFLISRQHVLEYFPDHVNSKRDAWDFESGPDGLTRRFFEQGLSVFVVGRNGRAYGPDWWPVSHTFRQGEQENLLVHDQVTRDFDVMSFENKREVSARTWGAFRNGNSATPSFEVPRIR
jgi:hypothetical protein